VNTRPKIDPAPDVQPNPVKLVRKLQETGQPAVLTINGEEKLIVQDATSYQMLLELVDRLDTIEAIREGIASIERGEGRPADEVFEEIRRKYNIPRGA
jgi:PHD/YefM family antitoxin component YafN of YafNO toxin-antitoxin module